MLTVHHTPGIFKAILTRNLNLQDLKRMILRETIMYISEVIAITLGCTRWCLSWLLNANNAIPKFNEFKYSQNVTNLYPELDKDNPMIILVQKSFAKGKPIGEVVSNDLTKDYKRKFRFICRRLWYR